MRNASRRSARTPLDEEPRRTSFICACCGREVVTAIEGLFYNHPVGSERRFCDAACRQAAWRRRKAGPPRAHRSSAGEAAPEGWLKAAIRRAEQTRS